MPGHHVCLCCQRRSLLQGLSLLLLPPGAALAQGREGVEVGGNSVFSRLVPADTVEQSAAQQYAGMLQQAAAQNALVGKNHPEVRRLRAIAQRIIPHALGWNPRAKNWRWEVNLIGSQQINAFCMPGGKIAFFSGILDRLKLTDNEVATVMGHEMAHALREHARARMAKNAATGIGANLLSNVLGLGQLGQTVTSYGAQLLTLWQKMAAASQGIPPQWLSTHPSGNTRIADIQANLPKVLPLYARRQNK